MIGFRFKNISRKTMGVTHFAVETNGIYFKHMFIIIIDSITLADYILNKCS